MHLQVRRDIQKSFFLTYWTLFEPGALRTKPFRTALHRCRLVQCAVWRMYQTGPDGEHRGYVGWVRGWWERGGGGVDVMEMAK